MPGGSSPLRRFGYESGGALPLAKTGIASLLLYFGNKNLLDSSCGGGLILELEIQEQLIRLPVLKQGLDSGRLRRIDLATDEDIGEDGVEGKYLDTLILLGEILRYFFNLNRGLLDLRQLLANLSLFAVDGGHPSLLEQSIHPSY